MIDAEHVLDLEHLRGRATRIREYVLQEATGPEGAHVGGALSAVDILAVLYCEVLRLRPEEPHWPERDHFILSKGHASAALYATLAECGFVSPDELSTYARSGGRLAGHPLGKVPGVEFPTGSLGHGLSLGVGLALGAKRDGRPNRTFVLTGDGELQEGSNWEAIMAAAHHRLDNLVAIVDRNGLQINGPTEQRMTLEPLADRWRSFGWSVAEVDGHDLAVLHATLMRIPLQPDKPSVLIARTVKGRGVRLFEGRTKSHYVVMTPELYRKAVADLRRTQDDVRGRS